MIDSTDVPLQTIEEKDPRSLFTLLESRDEETFSQRCAKNRGRLDENNGKFTYLQLACWYGLPRAVEALLSNGADPNRTCHLNQCPPIMIAGQGVHCNIVNMLALTYRVNFGNTVEGTVLHALLEGMSKARERDDSSFVIEEYNSCIKLLLETRWSNLLDINAKNRDGFTALHLAVKLQQRSIIFMLLEHGAYIGSRCSQGYTAISLMNADVFEEYLNNCISTNSKQPIDNDYEIIYDYGFLDPLGIYCNKQKANRGNHALFSETKPLIEISRVPELYHLLKHPVFASFLHMKWFTVRKYFWINFYFFLTFWFCLTLHTIAQYSPNNNNPNCTNSTPTKVNSGQDEVQYNSETTNICISKLIADCTWYPSIFLCGLLSLREFFKFYVSPRLYVFDMENLLNIPLLTLNLFVLFASVEAGVAAFALLLTWAEMILLINRHPLVSSNIEMYKKVCTSLVKLLAWWSMLIVAFALSFYLLFKDYADANGMLRNNDTEENNSMVIGNLTCNHTRNDITSDLTGNLACNLTSNLTRNYKEGMSIFKVILVMMGQSETSTLPFQCHPYISHGIYFMFQFLVPIVLFNLMNGLMAASDTEVIRSDAKIFVYATLAKRIASIEKMMVNCSKISNNRFFNVMLNLIEKRRLNTGHRTISVFYKQMLHDSKAHVHPNQRKWWIHSNIMNETKKILQERESKRQEKEHSSNFQNMYPEKLEEYGQRLALLEKTTNEKQNEVIEKVTLWEETTNEKLNNVIERVTLLEEMTDEKLNEVIERVTLWEETTNKILNNVIERVTLLELMTDEKLNNVIERVTLLEKTTHEKLNTTHEKLNEVIELLRQR